MDHAVNPTDITPTMVLCPTCKKPVQWLPDSHFKPFCSQRCRLIDWGEWLDEGYRVPLSQTIDDK